MEDVRAFVAGGYNRLDNKAGDLSSQTTVTLSTLVRFFQHWTKVKAYCSPYSIAERRVLELAGSQPTGDVSHKPGGRLPLLSTRPAVTFPARRPVPVSLLGEQRHDGCEQFA